MGKVIPLRRPKSASPAASSNALSLAPGPLGVERELWPIAALLFVLSLARVVHALLRNESFGSVPTLALACVVGLLAAAWRVARKTA